MGGESVSRVAEFKDGKLVYRDATKEEEAELTKSPAKGSVEEKTLEERLAELEERIKKLEGKGEKK